MVEETGARRCQATTTSRSDPRELSARLTALLWRVIRGRAVDPAAELRELADWYSGAPAHLPAPPKQLKYAEEIHRIYLHWCERTGRNPRQCRLTDDRRRKVRARLADGYSEQDIMRAIDGMSTDDFLRGENERAQRYDDLVLVCRDGATLERLRDSATSNVVESEAKLALLELQAKKGK